ncbi:flagellar basal body rod protein [Methylocella silvestris BL2]|uniref:Flagellar basal body rod protein n=1 Tax=Methylocella silvestris (strain DSM 15510 / CIP 108128 / LMG 27833 / NCIMB 13906 / BL2) TaxID=395965 RepID=B8EK64_METSB|nr:flagellar basal-body rod protein FlgF [Methylocella silvestris]ACK50604.1 flagellar basal body rod protein [Methylocella silvestris BL2]
MQSGLYVSLSGLVALDRRLTTIAANVANQSTPGYRAEEVEFKSLLSKAGANPVAFVSNGESFISRRGGVPIKTDGPLDVAVQGHGWLALKTPDGTVYTKDGRMHMEESGALVSVDGFPVLDAGATPILLDPAAGPPTIAQDGMITQNSHQVGAIGIFSLDGQAKLKRYTNSGVMSDLPATAELDFSNNGVHQGFIEGANINPILEMAKLIMVSRAFENIHSATEGSESSLKDAIKTLGATS